MDIEDIIQVIVDGGDVQHMHMLSDILDDVLEEICKYDKEKYKQYELKLYKMAYGNTFTREMAEEIVSKMRPYAMKWSIEETQQIQSQYGINDISPADFFIVLNMAYNDYNNIFNENIEMYVRFVDDFVNDEDAKEDKVFNYFTQIVAD